MSGEGMTTIRRVEVDRRYRICIEAYGIKGLTTAVLSAEETYSREDLLRVVKQIARNLDLACGEEVANV